MAGCSTSPQSTRAAQGPASGKAGEPSSTDTCAGKGPVIYREMTGKGQVNCREMTGKGQETVQRSLRKDRKRIL